MQAFHRLETLAEVCPLDFNLSSLHMCVTMHSVITRLHTGSFQLPLVKQSELYISALEKALLLYAQSRLYGHGDLLLGQPEVQMADTVAFTLLKV